MSLQTPDLSKASSRNKDLTCRDHFNNEVPTGLTALADRVGYLHNVPMFLRPNAQILSVRQVGKSMTVSSILETGRKYINLTGRIILYTHAWIFKSRFEVLF